MKQRALNSVDMYARDVAQQHRELGITPDTHTL